MSELKCCKLWGAFSTCETKTECCPECQYFDEIDSICLAPEALKKSKAKAKVIERVEDVDPETFLFEDDDEDEDEDSTSSDLDDDDLLVMDDWDWLGQR